MGTAKLGENRAYLKVVAKTLRLIETMADLGHEARLTDLSRTLKFPKATTFRILFTLERLGYVEQSPGAGAYRLSDKTGWSHREHFREALRSISRPFMERLLVRFEQTVNLGVLDHGQILYLEILEGLRLVHSRPTINSFGPIHSTALGKAILAALSPAEAKRLLEAHTPFERRTKSTLTSVHAVMRELVRFREQGYAVDNEETEAGARCVGAPILGPGGQPAAAISISGPVSAMPAKTVREVAQALKGCTRAISPQLGYTPTQARAAS